MSSTCLIVGLGNPGKKYDNNRHNVGWKVLDELARRYRLSFDKTEKKALTASGMIGDHKVLLAKPQTFMNASGEAVRGLVDFYKIDLAQVVIVSDDLDIPLGTLRLRKTGGAGGQRGVKNIIQHLGTKDFSRVRFGIGRPPGKMDPAAYVLQDFKGDEAILAQEVITVATDAVETWLRDGIDVAMTQFNGDIREQQAELEPDPQAQLDLYMRAFELNPRDPGPVEKIIGVLKRLKRIDEAVEWHLKAADLLEQQGKKGAAITQRERATSLKPELIDIHRQIVANFLAMDNKKKAVQRLLILARYFERQGQFDEAANVVREALEINPQHPKALEMQENLRENSTG